MNKRNLPYQDEDAKFIAFKNPYTLLNYEAGLGKTVTALKAISLNIGEALIVVPKHLVEVWEQEINKWIPKQYKKYINITTLTQCYREPNASILKSKKFKWAIIDEAHYLRNYKSNYSDFLYRLVMGLFKRDKSYKAERILLLTATPVINEPLEFYRHFKMLRAWRQTKSLFMHTHYKMEYNYGAQRMLPTKLLNPHLITDLLGSTRIFRTRKSVGFPKPRIEVKMNYKDGKEMPTDFRTLARFKRELNTDKLKDYQDTILDQLGKYRKCLIYLLYLDSFKYLKKHLTANGIKCYSINGSTKKNMNKTLDSFSKDKRAVLMMSINCANSGLNIYDVDAVIMQEVSWSHQQDYQAVMRAYRLDRNTPLNVYYNLYKQEHTYLINKSKGKYFVL